MTCFDEEPEAQRTLLWHAESECVFESVNATEIAECLGYGCDDVTGDPHFEKLFLEQPKIPF